MLYYDVMLSYSILNRFFQIEFIRRMLCVMDSSALLTIIAWFSDWSSGRWHWVLRGTAALQTLRWPRCSKREIMIFSLLATTIQLVAINNAQGIK